jgi:APA family basic amino acid/polyamine antiporter
VARKLRGFERVLDAPSLFAIAYGEIASSLYIALGIVAGAALGLTPLVLLVTGGVFVLVSLSYAEGTTALPETGGAATFVRRAFNDLAGFVTGWVLFLDFLIVMALSAVFVPHYLAGAIGKPSLQEAPWDAIVGCALIAGIAGVRLVRRTRLHVGGLAVALLDLLVQGLLVLLGLAFLLSPHTLREGFGFASGQDWSDLAFALPLAMLAYTGLETVANLAEEATEPGRTLPRSLFSAIGLVVVVTVLIGAIGLSAYPVANG